MELKKPLLLETARKRLWLVASDLDGHGYDSVEFMAEFLHELKKERKKYFKKIKQAERELSHGKH